MHLYCVKTVRSAVIFACLSAALLAAAIMDFTLGDSDTGNVADKKSSVC